jgi:hypothetical protein
MLDRPQRFALRHTEDEAMLLTDGNFDDVIAWVESTGAEVTWRGRQDHDGIRAFEICNAWRGRPWQRNLYEQASVGTYVVLRGDDWFHVQGEEEFAFRHGLIIDGNAKPAAVETGAE